MKKFAKFLLVIPALLMMGCKDGEIDKSKIALDYGFVRNNPIDYNKLYESRLTSHSLEDEIEYSKNFVLVVYSAGCGCWTTFAYNCVIPYINNYNVDIKVIDRLEVGEDNPYGIYVGTGALLPSICFFRRGELVRQTVYLKLKGKNQEIFTKYSRFEKFMNDNIYLPHMYYVDKDKLDSMISADTTFNLYVAKTGCPDCEAIDQSVLFDWSTKNKKTTINDLLYIFDIAPYVGTADYQDIKDYCGLSVAGSATFGFDNGYVPTFQRRTGAVINDMITVLNDYASEELVVTSYFNQTRIDNSPMLQTTGDTYLFNGRTITAEQRTAWGSVNQELQLEWHSPIVKLYLDTYVK